MDEYGPDCTLKQVYEYDRERVEHALDGELKCGQDENGFIYEPASPEACREFILEVVDVWYGEAQRLSNCGKVMEAIIRENGGITPLH